MLCDTVLLNDRQVRPRPKFDAYAHNETETAIAERLAVLEARDPSQKRPTPKRNVNNNVDWIDL